MRLLYNYGIMSKTLAFEAINDKKIFNILSEPELPQKKLIIMAHGFRGTSIGPSRTFVDFERVLLSRGYSVLRFDQPNSGNSEGEFLNSSFNEWIDTIVYFAKKYIDKSYTVNLLGQSMGATATMIAASKNEIKNRVSCVILWVPDPKSTFDKEANKMYEEGGQKYKGIFWQEAKDADFFNALKQYNGGIHLVYGEHDKYISQDLRSKVIEKIKEKGQQTMILPDQDHSSWDFEVCQELYKNELEFIEKYERKVERNS